ncbi:MAG: hypothetical protein ABIP35_13185 [Ginsengibacter sp.]
MRINEDIFFRKRDWIVRILGKTNVVGEISRNSKNMKLFSYIVANDYGLAPNPFWNSLTLAVCKPAIRRTATKNDWVIGTGSKNVIDKNGHKVDHSGKLVFAMQVDKVLSLAEYDEHCKTLRSDLKYKLPHNNLFKNDWRHKVGDNIYDYSNCSKNIPGLRKVIHTEEDKERDLGGLNALISKHFYYFGNSTKKIPITNVVDLLKMEQGHLVLDDCIEKDKIVISEFLSWLKDNFIENKVYDNPQLYWDIDNLIIKKKRCHKLKKAFNLDN